MTLILAARILSTSKVITILVYWELFLAMISFLNMVTVKSGKPFR